MRKWMIRKVVEADTLKEAMAKELLTEVIEAKLIVREKEQLTSLIGTDSVDNDHDYWDEGAKIGFKN